MKAKEVFVLPMYPDGHEASASEYIVAFTTGNTDEMRDARGNTVPEITKLTYAGRFQLRAYAVKFAQILKEGAA